MSIFSAFISILSTNLSILAKCPPCAETRVAETRVAKTGVAEIGVTGADVAETGVDETGVADADVAETGIADADVAETGVAQSLNFEFLPNFCNTASSSSSPSPTSSTPSASSPTAITAPILTRRRLHDPPSSPPSRASSPSDANNSSLPASIQHHLAWEASPPTNILHVVFGIAASAKLWEKRKEYIKLWYKPEAGMRGVVWLWYKSILIGGARSGTRSRFFIRIIATVIAIAVGEGRSRSDWRGRTTNHQPEKEISVGSISSESNSSSP